VQSGVTDLSEDERSTMETEPAATREAVWHTLCRDHSREDRSRRIAIHPGLEDRLGYLGWEVRDNAAFKSALAELLAKRVAFQMADEATAAERQVSGMARLTDPAGYMHEIFWGAVFTVGSFLPGNPMKGFVAGPLGVGHVVVAVLQITIELESRH
jgi:extradiol dioxygenase